LVKITTAAVITITPPCCVPNITQFITFILMIKALLLTTLMRQSPREGNGSSVSQKIACA
jgi:hypothetical protein